MPARFRSDPGFVCACSRVLDSRVVVSLLFSLVVAAELWAATGGPLQIPLGLRVLPVPADNPLSVEILRLGKQLFFDQRLSRDNTVSCATCHTPSKGWSNGQRVATGVDGRVGTRSVPTLINAGYQAHFFWDGRLGSLEAQVRGPIENPNEMGLPMEQLVSRMNEIVGYRQQFQEIFGSEATPERIAQALASFVRTILSGDAPYDRFRAGDLAALSPAAQRGHDIFFFRANCAACHRGPNFTDGQFHNLGIGMDQAEPDLGRFVVTQIELDRGAFKTPTLREIARTAPYMHDGRFKTLEEVVDFYSDGGLMTPNKAGLINVLLLSDQEKSDLVVFLKEGLSSKLYPNIALPKLPQ